MTSKQIYNGTKKFPMRLLLLNAACVAVALVLFMLFGVISLLTKSGTLLIGGAWAALFVYGILHGIMYHYIGYMFKYGSVHAIAMAYNSGKVSKTYFEDSVEYIKSGFLKANAYLVVDKLVSKAVRGVTRLVNFILGFLPKDLKNIVDTFINTYLNYIDECCLGWSMLHPTENVIKTSCDGVVIYYQNAKNMLKPAVKTTIRIYLTDCVVFLIGCCFMFCVPLAIIWWLIGYSIVQPFLNHRVLCNVMVAYLDCAMNTEIKKDLYGTLSKCRPFKALRAKIGDPMFDPAPGNENIDINTMKVSVQEQGEEQQGYYDESAQDDNLENDSGLRGTFEQVKESVRSTVYEFTKPQIPDPAIPDPPKEEPTQEQIYWQKAWDRMTAEQKKTYNNMDATKQRAWKAQILKALYNYEI